MMVSKKTLSLCNIGLSGLLMLAGCGITYTSPTVETVGGDTAVRVVALTPQTIPVANRMPYEPRRLPGAFHRSTGGAVPRGAGALPTPPPVPIQAPQSVTLRLPPPVPATPYRIGIGDVVQLAMRAAPTTTDTGGVPPQNSHTVRDDGTVALPDLGAVKLGGLTLPEAERAVFDLMVANQIDPAFSLEVSGFNSKRIAVGGAVSAPTLVPVTLTLPNLAEALTLSGGLTAADKDYGVIRLYRNGTLYQIPLKDYLDRADLQQMPLLAGDAIFVDQTFDLQRAMEFYAQRIDVINVQRLARAQALAELQTEIGLRRSALDEERANFQARSTLNAAERDYVYLAGEVAQQARVPLPYEHQASLADVLYETGGVLTETGDPAHIYVLRASPDPAAFGAVTAWHLNAGNAAMIPLATRLEMRPNDVIFVQEQPITRWNRALKQFFPPLLSAATR